MTHHRVRHSGGAPRLVQYRLALGLTQAEVVERLHELAWTHVPGEPFTLDRASYARWESGERRPRSKVARRLMCMLFSATEYELGLRSIRQLLLPGAASGDEPGGNVESLALLAAAPAPLDWERLRSARQRRLPVDRPLLADLQGLTAALGSNRYQTSPASVLPLLHAHVTSLRELLNHSGSDETWRELARLAGYTAVIAGQLWRGLTKRPESAACYAFAEALAREAEDDRVMAAAMGSRSVGLTVERLEGRTGAGRAAVQLLDEATHLLGSASDSPLRSWLLGCRAWERAALGDERGANEDLDAADQGSARSARGVDSFLSQWGPEFRDVGVLAYRGRTALVLGSTGGLGLLAEATRRIAPEATTRISLLTDLAVALIERDEVEHACDLLMQAIDRAGGAKVAVLTNRIRRVRSRELARFATLSTVRDLDERLAALPR